jgi:hypothetical protein
MWTAEDVLADLLNTPEVTRRREVFMYDPDLAGFGNALSPIVRMPSYGAAQRALQRPLSDRYSSRYDQPDATDWLMMAVDQAGQTMVGQAAGDGGGQALWRKLDDVIVQMFGWNPTTMSGSSRWYPAITDGSFADLVYTFKQAGATCTGDPPKVTCRWLGATFVLLHDVEGPLRVFITDYGPFGSGTTRTSGFFQTVEDKTGMGTGALLATLAIVGVTGLLAARNPKHALAISAAGAAGVAVALAANASKHGARIE